jgi:hypothetical protein
VLDTVAGILVASASLYWRPTGWLLFLCAAVCFTAFGTWGITDRELSERPPDVVDRAARALRATRALAVVIGIVATIALLLVGCGLALGSFVS